MSSIWAVSSRADLLGTEELRDIGNVEVADGEVAIAFDSGSEDGPIIYAPNWATLADDLARWSRLCWQQADNEEEN